MMLMRYDTYEMMHDELKDVLRSNPTGSEAEHKEQLWEKFKGNADVMRLLYDNWFNANYHRYEVKVEPVITKDERGKKIEGQNVVVWGRPRGSSLKNKKQKRKIVEKIIKKRASVILMNLPMPNGKTLKDCTGAECLRIGGWVAAVGEAIKPTEKVGKQLSETDLQNLYMRNAA